MCFPCVSGVSVPRASRTGFPLPNARRLSSLVHASRDPRPTSGVTLLFVAWGQLIDHDLTQTAETKGEYNTDKCTSHQNFTAKNKKNCRAVATGSSRVCGTLNSVKLKHTYRDQFINISVWYKERIKCNLKTRWWKTSLFPIRLHILGKLSFYSNLK